MARARLSTTILAALAVAVLVPSAAVASGSRSTASAHPLQTRPASSGWHVQRTPDGGPQNNQLTSVSCTAEGACMAVGLYENQDGTKTFTLAEAWNGVEWRIIPTPDRYGVSVNALYGVACASATSCIAVGNSGARPLAISWDGSTWRAMPIPAPKAPGRSDLRGLACASAMACVAVGGFHNDRRAFSETWDGTVWRIRPVPQPEGTRSAYLIGASCSSPTACTAVGNYQREPGQTLTLAERWNGIAWIPQATPNRGKDGSYLYGVSCPQTSECIAVGFHGGNRHPEAVLMEAWHGAAWTIEPTGAAPPGTLLDELTAVSCLNPMTCTAVGDRVTKHGTRVALGATWNGAKWRLSDLPPTSGKHLFVFMQSVSCTGPTTCTAVGSRGVRTLADHRP
jgi:hypothetical protein